MSEPQPERCRAILKAIWRWRCHRRGYGQHQLCAQHQHFGCTVPGRWVHETNERGVDVPRPRDGYTKIPRLPVNEEAT